MGRNKPAGLAGSIDQSLRWHDYKPIGWIKFAISKNFGVGLNYNYFELDAGMRDDDWRGSADVRYHGPYLSIDAYW